MVMRSVAIDLAPRRIICAAVNPGWVKTNMGAPAATLTPQQSVAAVCKVVETLTPEQSGKFYHYDGTEYPW
jgi:NAD(P)-dependent dehydrogenase (short-subunit alcohol dehydrogenase family)